MPPELLHCQASPPTLTPLIDIPRDVYVRRGDRFTVVFFQRHLFADLEEHEVRRHRPEHVAPCPRAWLQTRNESSSA